MDKPTFREFANHEKKIRTRLIKTDDNRFYIESTPYKFKLVQLLLFLIITACALLAAYLIPSIANRTSWVVDDYRNMESNLLIIPLIYFIITQLLFIIELPQRYLFAGFIRVSENYFKDKGSTIRKRSKPLFLDVFRDTIFHQITNEDLDYKYRRDRFIYCYSGRVFIDKYFWGHYSTRYMLWSILPILLMIASIQALDKDVLLSFRYTIAVSAVLVFQNLVYPVIRYVFNKFEEVDINEINKKEEYKPRLIID